MRSIRSAPSESPTELEQERPIPSGTLAPSLLSPLNSKERSRAITAIVRLGTLAIIGFVSSFTCYGLIGFYWLLYDAQFSLIGMISSNTLSTEASKIQEVMIFSLIGAIATAFIIVVLEWGSSSLNYSQKGGAVVVKNVSKDEPKDATRQRTITFTTRSLLRAGSFVAGLVSVVWGLYAVLAFQVVVTTTNSQSLGNPYSNYTFVTFAMYEAVIIGLFALVLALLSR